MKINSILFSRIFKTTAVQLVFQTNFSKILKSRKEIKSDFLYTESTVICKLIKDHYSKIDFCINFWQNKKKSNANLLPKFSQVYCCLRQFLQISKTDFVIHSVITLGPNLKFSKMVKFNFCTCSSFYSRL